MPIKRNKIFVSLALAAALSFSVIALGGNYLHNAVHHHTTQQENDNCPVFQLLTQAILTVAVFAAATIFVPIFAYVGKEHISRSSFCLTLPYLRGPPA